MILSYILHFDCIVSINDLHQGLIASGGVHVLLKVELERLRGHKAVVHGVCLLLGKLSKEQDQLRVETEDTVPWFVLRNIMIYCNIKKKQKLNTPLS